MTRKVITLEFVVPTLLAIALGIVLSIGAVYLTDKYLVPIDQAEAHHSIPGSRWFVDLTNPRPGRDRLCQTAAANNSTVWSSSGWRRKGNAMRIFLAILIALAAVYFWDVEYNNGVLSDGVRSMGRSIAHSVGL
jgi:hypothetical protein